MVRRRYKDTNLVGKTHVFVLCTNMHTNIRRCVPPAGAAKSTAPEKSLASVHTICGQNCVYRCVYLPQPAPGLALHAAPEKWAAWRLGGVAAHHGDMLDMPLWFPASGNWSPLSRSHLRLFSLCR